MTSPAAGGRRLGRKAPRPARYMAGRNFLALDVARHLACLPPIPDRLDLTDPWPELYLGHNDEIGDCGVAGLANILSMQARREGRRTAFDGLPNIDDRIRDLYFEHTGGADDGVLLLDFLHWVQRRPDGFLGEKIGEPIAINMSDWQQVTIALALGFGIYYGATITEAAVRSAPGSFWRTDDGDQTEAGGHCMVQSGYITAGSYGQPNLSTESWALKFFQTWGWLRTHADEGYIVVDLDRPSQFFNLEHLRVDLAALKSTI